MSKSNPRRKERLGIERFGTRGADARRPASWRRLLWALLASLALACDSGAHRAPTGGLDDLASLRDRDDVNLLFILVDTLRADRLGIYGYERDTSPTIDALAQEGIRFGHHVSQSSWTKCSMASLWTGLRPARTGVLRADQRLPEAARMPAEFLREAGFRTAAIWRNSWIAPNFGFAQGFELYYNPPTPGANDGARARRMGYVPGSDADLIRSASEFLRVHSDERWFLYLHLMDVHQYVYDETSALFGTDYPDAYDNSIRWVDSLLGHLFEELEALGLRERTVIVFSSDHGEAFGEHGGEGHARNVYGEVTTTPLIVGLPFRLQNPIVVEGVSENVDLWPTILDLLGLPGLEDPDGVSLLPAIRAAGSRGAVVGDGIAFAQIDQNWARLQLESRPTVAMNSDRWRTVYFADRPDPIELYNKDVDSAEQRDVADEHPELVEDLLAEIEDYLDGPAPPWGEERTSIEIDEMQMQQLRAIGYGVP